MGSFPQNFHWHQQRALVCGFEAISVKKEGQKKQGEYRESCEYVGKETIHWKCESQESKWGKASQNS